MSSFTTQPLSLYPTVTPWSQAVDPVRLSTNFWIRKWTYSRRNLCLRCERSMLPSSATTTSMWWVGTTAFKMCSSTLAKFTTLRRMSGDSSSRWISQNVLFRPQWWITNSYTPLEGTMARTASTPLKNIRFKMATGKPLRLSSSSRSATVLASVLNLIRLLCSAVASVAASHHMSSKSILKQGSGKLYPWWMRVEIWGIKFALLMNMRMRLAALIQKPKSSIIKIRDGLHFLSTPSATI